AADKEMKEEIGIDLRNTKATVPLGYMDHVFSDPRCHGVRFVYLRWVEQEPKSSAELQNVVAAPLSVLSALCSGEQKWRAPDGREFGLILNHDLFLRVVMLHPMTAAFLA